MEPDLVAPGLELRKDLVPGFRDHLGEGRLDLDHKDPAVALHDGGEVVEVPNVLPEEDGVAVIAPAAAVPLGRHPEGLHVHPDGEEEDRLGG